MCTYNKKILVFCVFFALIFRMAIYRKTLKQYSGHVNRFDHYYSCVKVFYDPQNIAKNILIKTILSRYQPTVPIKQLPF